MIQYLCAQGIRVAAPNVRGSTGYGRTYHHLDDVELRLDAVRDLAALGARSARARAARRRDGRLVRRLHDAGRDHRAPGAVGGAVDIVGIANFVTFLERTGAYRRALREAEYGSLERDREFLESISPIHKVDRIVAR